MAFLLLLLFIFSCTPKKYLHDLVADHEDYYSFHSVAEASVNQSGINCDCEDLVVATHFIEASSAPVSACEIAHNLLLSHTYHFWLLITSRTKDVRGPPSWV